MLIILLWLKKIKGNDRVRITRYKNVFSKDYVENWSREKFSIGFVLKSNTWTYKIKDLKREKVIGSSYEKKIVAW